MVSVLLLVTAVAAAQDPEAHVLSEGPWTFTAWDPESDAETYPANAIVRITTERNDPRLDTDFDAVWTADWNLTARARAVGLGEDGIGFINTGNESNSGGWLGTFDVALDTRGMASAAVTFTAGTVTRNERTKAWRLQARAGEAPFADVLDGAGDPVEYVVGDAGTSETFTDVALPAALMDQPRVELRWIYHQLDDVGGQRPLLRLDDITVTGVPGEPPVVEAESLGIAGVTGPGQSGAVLPAFTVSALDADGAVVVGEDGAVTLSVEGGALSGTLVRPLVDGVATFDDVAIEGAGEVTLRAISGELGADEATLRVLRLTAIHLPATVQGEQPDNESRVPYPFFVEIEGLAADATYRYGNRFVTDEDSWDQNGGGDILLPRSDGAGWFLRDGGMRFRPGDLDDRHAELVADGDGVWRGWLVGVPSGTPRLTPGLPTRMVIVLNDGAGGEDPSFFLRSDEVSVRAFGDEPVDATGLWADVSAAPGNMMLLYADAAGATRPVAGAIVEATGVEYARYAAFYREEVQGQDGRFGTLIPNDLAAGVQRLEERSGVDGSLVRVWTLDAGLAGTVNADGTLVATGVTAAPTFDPGPGSYPSVSVTLSGPAGAAIRYTLDGSPVTEDSPLYEGPIALPSNTTTVVAARAFAAGFFGSPEVVAEYEVSEPPATSAVLAGTLTGLDAGEAAQVRVERDGATVGPITVTGDGSGATPFSFELDNTVVWERITVSAGGFLPATDDNAGMGFDLSGGDIVGVVIALTPTTPSATVPVASEVTATALTLSSTVQPDGRASTVVFALDGSPAGTVELPAGDEDSSVSVRAEGLACGTSFEATVTVTNDRGLDFTAAAATVATAECPDPDDVASVVITEVPATGQDGGLLRPVVVEVRDADGDLVAGATSVTLVVADGAGTLDGTVTVDAEDGVATFEDLTPSGLGEVRLVASAGVVTSEPSTPLRLVRLVEQIVPQVIQGQQPDNENRMLLAFRVGIEGLLPDATYRYGNRVVTLDDPLEQNGGGHMLLIPSTGGDFIRNTSAPRFRADDLDDRHVELTTDAEGRWEGWMVSLSSSSDRLTPGEPVRLLVLLNDGEGGEELHHWLRTPSTLDVVAFGEGADAYTGVWGSAVSPPQSFVVLYGDGDGAERPLYANVIESTGITAEEEDRYAPFYAEHVAAQDGRWGAMLPGGLVDGIGRYEERSAATGEILDVVVFPGGFAPTAGLAGEAVAIDRVPDPSFSVTPGTYDVFLDVDILVAPGAEARFTMDGTTPTRDSALWDGEPFAVEAGESLSLQVRAFRDDALPSRAMFGTWVVSEDAVAPARLSGTLEGLLAGETAELRAFRGVDDFVGPFVVEAVDDAALPFEVLLNPNETWAWLQADATGYLPVVEDNDGAGFDFGDGDIALAEPIVLSPTTPTVEIVNALVEDDAMSALVRYDTVGRAAVLTVTFTLPGADDLVREIPLPAGEADEVMVSFDSAYGCGSGILATARIVNDRDLAAEETVPPALDCNVVPTDEPGTDEPGTDEPGTDEPGTDEPGTGTETDFDDLFDDDVSGGGCGCSAAPAPGAGLGWGLLLLGLLALRRRR